MQKFVYKIINLILNIQQSFHKKRMQNITASFQTGSNKRIFHGANELVINSQTELKKIEL